MKRSKLLIFFIAVLAIANLPRLFSQQPYFKYYALNDGFPHPQVWDILQDKNGFMWFATAGGLVRYDGIEFILYSKDDGLPSTIVRSIFQDDDGKLWLGTDDGVSVFDGKNFRNFTTENGLPAGSVWGTVKDRKGRYWFSTDRNGLAMYDGKTFMSLKKKDGLLGDAYRSVFMDSRGDLWFSSKDGTSRLEFSNGDYTKTFENFSVQDGYFDAGITAIREDRRGKLLFCTEKGLVALDRLQVKEKSGHKKQFSFFATRAGSVQAGVNAVLEATDSSLWIATGHGLTRITKGQIHHYLADENFSSNSLHAICEDREGAIWVGTDGGGCFKIPYQNIFNYTIKDGLSSNTINAVTGDTAGHIFIATDNGVDMFDGKQLTQFSKGWITPGNIVWSLKIDSRNHLWVGTEKNLFEYDRGRIVNHEELFSVAHSQAVDLEEDAQGWMWLGTLNGLVVFDGKAWHHYTKDNGLPGNQVWCVYKDRHDVMWLGLNGGLAQAIPSRDAKDLTFKSWTTKDGLMDNTVNVVRQDGDGNYWIGTDLGVSKFDGTKFTNFKAKSIGLYDNVVTVIEFDDHLNQLWIGSKGFGRFNHHAPEPELLKLLTKSRGILAEEPTTNNSLFMDSKRDLWIGTFGGLTQYFDDPRERKVPPPVFIERIQTHDSTFKTNFLSDASFDTTLVIKDNVIIFQFACLSFLNEKENRYEYKLDGFDKDWSRLTSKNEVRYTNLGYGTYTFTVKARNSENVFSVEPAKVTFTIPIPFWLHPLFLLLVVGVTGFGTFKLYRFRVHKKVDLIFRRNKYLEQSVEHRTGEILKQKEALEDILEKLKQTQTQLVQSEKMAALGQLVAGVAHEINNPTSVLAGNMNYIDDYLTALRKLIAKYETHFSSDSDFGEEVKQFKTEMDYEFIISDLDVLIASIKNAGERIRNIVLDLRNFSRLDEVELNEVNINSCIDTTVKLFMNQFRHVLTIHKNYQATHIIYCYVNQINQVLLNLLINAAQAIEIKHADHGAGPLTGRIDIETLDEGLGGITVIIRDNGHGIPEAIRSKIFDPFYTTKPVGQGTGLGLSITYSIVEKHHGRITFDSKENEWTEFRLYLPFKPHEIPS